MDTKELEFWGNFFLSAAKGQQDLDSWSQWLRKGADGATTGAEAMKALWAQMTQSPPTGSPVGPFGDWATAGETFLRSYEQMAEMLGMVPRAEHDKLKKAYADLEQKFRKQVEIIHGLRERLHLAEEKDPPGDSVEELMRQSGEQFQQFVSDCMSLFTPPAGTPKQGKQD